MDASERIKRFRRSVIGLLIGVLLCTLIILLAVYPYRPNNIFIWIILFIGSLPIVLLLEYMGEILFDNRIMRRTNRIVRILLGVVVMLLICAVTIILWNWAKPYMGTWS